MSDWAMSLAGASAWITARVRDLSWRAFRAVAMTEGASMGATDDDAIVIRPGDDY